ncbi:PREDICTED: dual specificity protein kinase shkE isoform X1 [Camelina sativa]|uniref:Dual specificity protein kinase shkE isoform X1 n=1 Tax=Camelina sativa TaxID=90675 RepID=A0ABM0UCQ4_CAMSA|nr:PREDICTED: dual specificity protein kinase shkE isoform X1 [Camelina sativa]
MAGNNSDSSLYQVLVEWCQRMETSQARLREDVDDLLLQEESRTGKEPAAELETEAEAEAADSWDNPTATWERAVSGFYFADSAYRTLMDSMGHAIHVTSAASGEITFWSRSAENLYHWYAEEVVGYRTIDVLVTEEYRNSLTGIRNRVCRGETWTGQFPFQKKTGELFMALVTKSPVYENGELVGVVTVSSDATLFNRMHPLSNEHQQQSHSNRQQSNSRKHQWHLPRAQIAAPPQVPVVPQYSSTDSNLKASKLRPQRNGDDSVNANQNSRSRDENVPVVASTTFEKYGSLADKFLGKLQRKITGNQGNEENEPILGNGINKSACGSGASSKASNAVTYTAFRDNGNGKPKKAEIRFSDVYGNGDEDFNDVIHNGDRFQYIGNLGQRKPPRGLESGLVSGMRGTKMSDLNGEIEDAWNTRPSGDPLPILGVSINKQQTPANQGNNRFVTDSSCEIRWEDLQLGEEVGRGSFAAVHRGVWNGSDVAIKVYFEGDYNAMTLTECKKEINIMKKLRHPNVLLFMGAVCTEEKSAIVMEYMPRGSLFKILHSSNQPLDKKRRLRMALDVARGMNYLHRRNPPIVHRDLKSSNLLVDRNWNVKVGDFGLSKWKNATFLSTKSGKGTPQWMAPEVLRSEPSNEKCDVFSFGVILWELMTTLIPWDRLNSIQVVGVVGFMDRRLDLPEGLNPRIASIIQDCWQTDPAKRPSFEELISQMMSLFRKPGSGAQEDDD